MFEFSEQNSSFLPNVNSVDPLVLPPYGFGAPPNVAPNVSALSGTSSFSNLVVSSVVDDFAANASTTGSVTVGGSRTGVVNFSRDRDWFGVSLQAGRSYRFNLNGNTLGDPTLALRNASGTQLAFNDDFNGLNSQITFTPTIAGTYYLDAGAYSSGTGSYTVLAIDTSPADDFAANTSTTGSVTVGG
ncbi:MAG: hypothetical protein RLZZ148_329, partial [Cyanobacteriota bacterium]